MNTVIQECLTTPPDLEVSIQAAAVLLSLAMRDTETPVQDLGQSLSRMVAAVTTMREGLTESNELHSELSVCIQSLQFHDRLIQQLAAVRNLLASLGPHGCLDMTGFSAKRWEELLRMLRDRLSADQHHQLFDLLMRNGEMDDELRGEILPAEGSVELFDDAGAALHTQAMSIHPHDTQSSQKLREFAFSDDDFNALRVLVKEHTGIALGDQKRELVYGRISRRLRALDLASFRDYREVLADPVGTEIVEFCNAITTNLTSFFREAHHFDYVREEILGPRLADPRASRRLRFWCAGCSSGEEPYSLAMTLLETIPDLGRWDVRILATDLDSDVLAKGQRGTYGADRVKDLAPARRSKFFQENRGDGTYTVIPELRELITFKQLNLMTPFPMKGPIDVIFCRNVVIYFDKDTQRDLFARMSRVQEPGAALLLGHSESLFKVTTDYSLIGKTIYRRTGA